MTKLSSYTLTLGNKEYLPLIIGGMGVEISTASLALEAARLGGIGHISDAMGPCVADRRLRTNFQSEKGKRFAAFRDAADKSAVKWDPEDVYRASLLYVRSTMERKKGDGGVFINVMEKLSMGAPSETLQARLRGALDGGIDGITLSAGLHTGTFKLIEDHPRFRDVQLGVIVSSARALKIFLRSAERARRLPDYVVVEGPLAGGHLGFGLDWQKYDLRSILSEVKQFLIEEGLTDLQVIAAGGVFTGSDAVDMLKLGASGVQVATRFTISQECGLPADIKQDYLKAREADVVVNMSSPAGYPMRMLSYSPSLSSSIKPNCESLGYMLDRNGCCAYLVAYNEAPVDAAGVRHLQTEKMCICYHFMKYSCYTCGHYVYRLKDTTVTLPSGEFYLPPAEDIFMDYINSEDYEVKLPNVPDAVFSPSSPGAERANV